jgi:hypothetical protein
MVVADATAYRNTKLPEGGANGSASNFMLNYNMQLAEGMTVEKMLSYWTEQKRALFERTSDILARRNGSEPDVEKQRLADIEHMKAQCEQRTITDVATIWRVHQKASVTLSVRDNCEPLKAPYSMIVSMRYNNTVDHWQIDDIEEGTSNGE